MSEDLIIYFILPNDCENEEATSIEMQEAFELCRQHSSAIEWLAEKYCQSKVYQKNDVIVFQKFEGPAYEALSTQKCFRVVGPWCIITSFSEKIEIPNNGSPIYNLSMQGLTITMTSIAPEVKRKLREKILLMGGIVSIHVTNKITHLISNTVNSAKYIAAKEQGISVMLEAWVEAVWQASQNKRVKATDDEFLHHKCLPFQNMVVSVSGLTTNERDKLKKIMEDNGGIYSGKMSIGKTHVLICKQGVNSEKFIVARKHKIPCVTMAWVNDSLEKGYALPDTDYQIYAPSSTPNKNDAPNPDFSIMSCISTVSGHQTNQEFSETANITNLSDFNATLLSTKSPKYGSTKSPHNIYDDLIDKIDIRQVKLAGFFLDGCIVYISGFAGEQRDKLCRILKSGGATRYDDISDRVTHVIASDPNAHDLRLFSMKGHNPPMLTVHWLIESINQKQLASEDVFLIKCRQTSEPGSSPLSKKGLTLLRNDISLVESEAQSKQVESVNNVEKNVMHQYMNMDQTENDTLAQLLAQGKMDSKFSCREKSKTLQKELNTMDDVTNLTDNTTLNHLFSGKTFKLLNFDEDIQNKLTTIINDLKGEIKSQKFKGITDYTVVPFVTKKIHFSSAEVVTDLWIYDCNDENKVVEMKFIHQPIFSVSQSKPLEGCVVSVSGYSVPERDYLGCLTYHLGGIYQDKFARITSSDKKLVACTHLVCSKSTGNKYFGALKWKVPVVTHNWLIHAAEQDKRLPEVDYRVDAEKPTDSRIVTNETSKQQETGVQNVTNKVTDETNTKQSRGRCESNESEGPSEKKRKFSKDSTEDEVFLAPVNLADIPSTSTSQAHEIAQSKLNSSMTVKLDDGRQLTVTDFLSELKRQGIFDPPSPVPSCESPSIVDKMMQEMIEKGLIPNKTTTPKRNETVIPCSQDTPVASYIKDLQRRKILISDSQPLTPPQRSQNTSVDMPTPDTPLGRFLGTDPSPDTRKHWKRYLNKMPERRPSTPMSEIKKMVWEKFLSPKTIDEIDKKYGEVQQEPEEENENEENIPNTEVDEETPSQIEVKNQIQKLEDMIKRRDSSSKRSSLLNVNTNTPKTPNIMKAKYFEAKESQNDTVGWDDPLESILKQQMLRIFMLSGLDKSVREEFVQIIKRLGGEILESSFYDPKCTHLVCLNPLRNEKILSCVAAGKWILHASYISNSDKAGIFLDEETYEFGNPKCLSEISSISKTGQRLDYMNWWRERISEQKKGAFSNFRALVFSNSNQAALIRLIEAGEGVVINISPPFNHNIDVTHCFIDPKDDMDLSEFKPLVKQNIHCLNVTYLAAFLNTNGCPNMIDFIPSELQNVT